MKYHKSEVKVKRNILICWITLIFFFFGCNQSKKHFVQRIDVCTSEKRIDDSLFFRIDKTRFDKSAILNSFKKGVIVDSSIKRRSDGSKILDYTFRDDSSKVIFVLYDHFNKKMDFQIIFFQIKTDIFKCSNNIKINMTRSDFFKTIETKINDCDTLDVFSNKPGYYYRCVFSDDKLKSIKMELIKL